MTTTLRPEGPDRYGADGARARDYTVCVNSRPVGRVRLATDERFGPETGRIVSLEIDEPDRRRGRGTVAALAAEEVLRGWRCGRIEVSIASDAPVALALAATLGYTERSRRMVKTLPATPPGLPAGSAVRPLDQSEFPAWLARARDGYARTWVRFGLTQEQAGTVADENHRAALPDGVATAHTALRVLTHGGTDVGTVLVRLRTPDAPEGPAWVFDVRVDEEWRGRGHGRTLMLAAERECLAAGVGTLGLNVLTDNTAALRLYESLDYAPTDQHFFKPLR